jgi:hypothetical protein
VGKNPILLSKCHRSCNHSNGADLKMFIDDWITPVMIRLTGVLEWSTLRPFLSAMEKLLVGGVLLFVLDAGELDVRDAWGASALILFQQRIRDCGGSLTWEGFESDRPGVGPAQEMRSCHICHGTELVFVPVTMSYSEKRLTGREQGCW